MMPPKLVKLAVNYLGGLLLQTVKNSIKRGLFSDNTTVGSVTPGHKKTYGNNSVLNFRPISVLNCPLKVLTYILKLQLMENIEQSVFPFYLCV